MAAIDPPFCKICGAAHSTREPHIFPANAPGEVRSKRAEIGLPAPAKASVGKAKPKKKARKWAKQS